MVIFGVIGTKGGVGKTTLSANLGALLADMGLRVLLVDADVQASLSKFYKLKHQAPQGLVKTVQSGIVTEDCISSTVFDGLDIILSDSPRRQVTMDDANSDIERYLSTRMDMPLIMRRALRCQFIQDIYDIVIVDTPGAQGYLLSSAALSTHKLICPVLPEAPSAREFNAGTISLFKKLSEAESIGVKHGDVTAVINRATQTRDARQIIDEIRKSYLDYEGHVTVANTIIPHSVIYNEAATAQLPVHRVQKRDSSSGKAFETMHQLAWELLPNIRGVYAGGFEVEEGGNKE